SDVALDTIVIQAGGSLRFRTDINTRVVAANYLILAGGELQVGTVSNPVAANVKAELIIANKPIDTTFDPQQYGTGLILHGKVTIMGAPMSDTFVRLGAEPRAGNTTLPLSSPVTGWRAGDKLYLPDTRQLDWNETGQNYSSQSEYPIISSISADGRVIT